MVNTVEKSGMRSVLICRCRAIAGRMACVLAAALLTCAFSAHAQVIEEGGFPVKGGDNSGEPFSLSCPSRLVVQAGSSIVLSCSATAVPEEGVRYEWEPVSVGGLDFLSAPDELSPLFMAPSSGAGEKYAYRLTATALGVYETADVTVSVEGFPEDDTRGEGSAGPGDCSSFAFEGYREGCFSKDEGSQPFGGFSGEEGGLGFPFPGSPGAPEEGLPGLLGAGDPAQQTAPYLDCPPAVFLEELETGSIECHVSDAVGEEFLEYMWEPVGSTTRDYLDNPRLIPEDAPNPSVVAPEAPVYETLESFRSGETTFRYRYRLTATSRATGLSSSSEVEVFVSSSRPSVYCPLEVVIEEGATIALDCEGVDPLSGRMDYDEDGASIEWEWSGLWGTSTTLLDGTDLSSPLFTAPAGSAGKEYHYIASMTSSASGESRTARRRVTVTVTGAEEGAQVVAKDSASAAGNKPLLGFEINCDGTFSNGHFYGVSETVDDFELDCEASGGPNGIEPTYVWTHIAGSGLGLLSATDIRNPTFMVPDQPSGKKEYLYNLRASANDGTGTVTVDLEVEVEVSDASHTQITYVGNYRRNEGDPDFDMVVEEQRGNTTPVTYSWMGRGSTPVPGRLSATDIRNPTFDMPENVDGDKTYRYNLTAVIQGGRSTTSPVTVNVYDTRVPVVTCGPADLLDGDYELDLDCSVTDEPSGATYSWAGDELSRLTNTSSLTPTFSVLEIEPSTPQDTEETYEYTVTLTADGIDDAVTADVTITVVNKELTCWVNNTTKLEQGIDRYVDEGAGDLELDATCYEDITSPGGGPYTYEWRGSGLQEGEEATFLTATDEPVVEFRVPGSVSRETLYTFTFYVYRTINPNTTDSNHYDTAHFTITVKDLDPVTCNDPPGFVYEGSTPFALDCTDTGDLSGVTWEWGPSSLLTHLTNTSSVAPTFTPPQIDESTKDFAYTVRAMVGGVDMGGSNVTVRVRRKPRIYIICDGDGSISRYKRYEGDADFVLDCEAGGAGGSNYTYTWAGRGSTVVPGKLSSATRKDPTFDVPLSVSSDEPYEYTLTATASNAVEGVLDVTVTVKNKPDIVIECPGDPYDPYEGEENFDLDCEATGAPSGSTYDYTWTARGSTSNTNKLIAGRNGPTPTFDVPGEVAANETYEYTLEVSAENAEDASEPVTVTVQNKSDITVTCTGIPYEPYEGTDDIVLDCSATGAPSGSTYDYVWTARGSTVVPGKLSSTTIAKPTFEVPPSVDSDETYEYTLTVSAEGAKDGVANVTVTVLNKLPIMVTCPGHPYEPYEGTDDIVLDCSASDAPGSTYDYVWTARGSTGDTAKLIAGTDGPTPTFEVQDEVDSDETYEYRLTASAENAEDGFADVTVTVKNKPSIMVTCPGHPYSAYEGESDILLDCSATGKPEDSEYVYAWTARGGGDTDKLSSTTIAQPTFDVPGSVNSDETYEYTLTASAENAEDGAFDVTVNVLKKATLALACTSPLSVYEGSPDFDLNCSASGAPEGSTYDYAWTGRGSTVVPGRLSSTTVEQPTFNVPRNVNADTDYEYTLTVSAHGAESETANVTVRVLNKPSLALICTPPAPVYEGAADFALDCVASGAPQGSTYDYVWTPRGSTVVPGRLNSTTIAKPTFDVPGEVAGDETYEYTLTVSAENAEDASAPVTVRVLNKPSLALVCTPPAPVYEGAADFDLDCSASGAPAGSQYDFVWTPRGATSNTDELSSTTVEKPTFDVPEEVAADTDYEYTLTVSAENAEDAVQDVTVTVLNKKTLDVACATPSPVYEGAADFALDCAASGAPAGSEIDYVWTARGNTSNTDLLVSGADGPTPTFDVPEEVDEDETYEYLLRVSAENAIDATAEVTVTVLKLGSIALICASPPLVYEGSADFALDCSVSGDTGDVDYTYAWTARGATANTDLLSATDIPSPTFYVPDALDETTTYEYLLAASAENAEDATAAVTVTVLNRGTLAVACASPPLVYEGAEDFALDCTASGAPVGSDYEYVWTARGNTANTDLLSAADIPSPTFYVPDALDATTMYEYLLTASAENAESGSAAVTVTVLNAGALSVVCTNPAPVYEGSPDFALDCSASGAPAGSTYDYDWTARGSTPNTDLLSDTTVLTPTFDVPEEVEETTTYEYLLTASAENAEDGTAEVTVTVLNAGELRVVCASPVSVYEGSADFALDCTASGAPAGSGYEYAWTARGSTLDTDLLSDVTLLTPTFLVPDALDEDETYEYLLTARAENAESASAEVTVTVLNRGALSVVCADPPSIYEGSDDFDLDCSASGASSYTYAWTARGSTANTAQLSAADIVSPTFYVPEELDATTTYEYLLTASAENTISGTAEVSVTVLNRGPLSVVCTDPGSIYEGSADFELDCSASGAPTGSDYDYAWTARGSTANTDQLSAIDIVSPTFYVPEEVDVTTTYEYLLTASAENAVDGTVEVTVTVLNKEMLIVTCEDTAVYEGSADFALDCSASGAPSGSSYTYVWTARGGTANTDLLTSGTDGPTPTFSVPEEVDENGETYEYLLTASAENAESASAEVTVNVLDGLPLALDDAIAGRVYIFTVGETIADILLPEATGGLLPYTHILTPLLPLGLSLTVDGDPTWTISGTPLEVSPRTEYTWEIVDANSESVSLAFFIQVAPAPERPSPPVAESLSLGVTASASSLRFGVQSAQTEVSLDPLTDQISTYVSGPYHGGRMTLALDGSEALDGNGEMDLSIELASPVVLRREGGIEDASIVLAPQWSLAESCEQLSSQTIGGLYTEVTLSEDACPLLLFGGELDLTDVPSGRYAGSMDIILRSGESEETHSVEVDVTVIPVQRVITIGPGGVRFSTSRELPASLTEEQNLSIYPHVAFLTEEKTNGVFELSNPSLIPLEVSVSARFGYTEATAEGREVVVEDVSESHLGDLSQVVGIHPGVLVLMPGEKGLVRYGMQEGALATMADKGYATFFDVVSEPRQYVRSDQMPEEVAGDRTARVTMRVPGVYVPGEGASQLRAALLSISYVGSLSATFLLETEDHPFVGEVLAYDGEGRELGRRETLVYTRSRVRIPLERVPEGGAVFLRFAPRGSERVPEPAPVEWDAPRRDIGAADKDRTRTPQTLVQKP